MTIGLPTIASQVRIGTTLILSDGSDWEAKPIFWTGFVGAPSSAKTPSLNVWAKPLRKRQGEEQALYDADLKGFEAQRKKAEAAQDFNAGPEGEPPSEPIKRIIDDFTTEALAKLQKEQPTHGCLIGVDELSGLLAGQNQYKKGGNDKQRLLSLRDGKGFSVTRASGDIATVSSSFSVTGGIQPTVLAKQMGDFSDGDGYWSRFCWCTLPLLPVVLESDGDAAIAFQLSNDISNALDMIGHLEPSVYRLSEGARKLHRDFCDFMDDKRLNHPNEAMKVVSGKSKGQVGEIALILHLLWGIGDQSSQGIPSREVSRETMTMAIEVMRFYIQQAELIQSLGAETQGDENPILVKIIELSRSKGWITASTVRNAIRSLKDDSKRDVAYVRGLFKELQSMDKGEL